MSNAIEDPRVRAAIEHYLLDLENTKPRNTRRNYLPKREEWKQWCQVNWPAIPKVWPAPVPQDQQLPGDLVDEGKLLLFMKEVVVSRPPRKGKRVTDDKKRHLEAQEVKRAMKRCKNEDSHSTAIQKAMPVVAEKLRTVLTQQVAAEQLAERRHANLL
ncbi:hypothetical protein HIM_12441 [Hirsutella minnesotensis 3608]|uniref:Uncharacterized protein n=1 Tax=Hirsutella minnesotensis 3608 TaxID=1043627 RepID=A0A0F7ZQN5_9HYPO|nr:hypothetical protein HIM_12441 [Hirsutella minnesotensis 3608]